MTIYVKRCDGCGFRFRHPDQAMVMGIRPPGELETIYHLCATCMLGLADGDMALNDRVMAAARKRIQSEGVLAA
jgi:hypothetical protein